MIEAKRISYHDIKAVALKRIRNKIWPLGSIMPGEVELAEEFGCARATVNRAMRELADEGFIDRKRKAGTRIKFSPTRHAKFAIPLIRDEIKNSGEIYRYALIRRERLRSPDWLRARLAMSQPADVLHLHCLHYAGSKPFQYEDRWINLEAVPKAGLQNFDTMGPNEWLVKEVPFTDAELTFSSINAELRIAELLGVSEGAALFTVERITWLETQPITFAKLSYFSGYQMTSRV